MRKRILLITITTVLFCISGYALIKSGILLGWPLIGGPCRRMDINTSFLEPVEWLDDNIELDPYYSRENPTRFYISNEYGAWPPNHQNLREDVILNIYPYLTVEGHYLLKGTYVYYLEGEELFYLWGDCVMNHGDGMVGPFVGDPRIELRRVAIKQPNPWFKSWWCPGRWDEPR